MNLTIATLLLLAGTSLAQIDTFPRQLNNTLYANGFPGADDGAKINAAIAACTGSCSVIDGSFLNGFTAAATITVNKSVTVIFPIGTFVLSGSPGVNLSAVGAAVSGHGPNASILQTNSGTADIVQTNALFWNVTNVGFRSGVARTGGAGLHVLSGDGYGEHLRFDKTFYGILEDNNSSGGEFHDLQLGAGLGPAGSWQCGIKIGGVASGTVTSSSFYGTLLFGDAAFTDAQICIYDGADSIYFYGTNMGHVLGISAQPVHIGRLVAGPIPQWIKFIGGNLEADSSVNNTVLDAGRDVEFLGITLQNGIRGLSVTGSSASCINCSFIGGNISQLQQECVKVSTGGFRLLGNVIGDCGEQTDNTYASVTVDAGVTDVDISNNLFIDIVGNAPANTASFNILVSSGSSDRYAITNNDFGQAHGTLSDGGSGGNKIILNPNTSVRTFLPQFFLATSSAFATATTAGTCVNNTTAVTGATTSMAVSVSPVSTPGVGAVWSAFVSSTNNVTINECAVATSAGGTIAFNIRVIP